LLIRRFLVLVLSDDIIFRGEGDEKLFSSPSLGLCYINRVGQMEHFNNAIPVSRQMFNQLLRLNMESESSLDIRKVINGVWRIQDIKEWVVSDARIGNLYGDFLFDISGPGICRLRVANIRNRVYKIESPEENFVLEIRVEGLDWQSGDSIGFLGERKEVLLSPGNYRGREVMTKIGWVICSKKISDFYTDELRRAMYKVDN